MELRPLNSGIHRVNKIIITTFELMECHQTNREASKLVQTQRVFIKYLNMKIGVWVFYSTST